MSADASDLEDEIVSRFLERVESNPDISPAMLEILEEVRDDEAFGGRDYLRDQVLEVNGVDAD